MWDQNSEKQTEPKNCGAQTDYRTAETTFFRAFCGLWVMNKTESKGGGNTIIPHGQPGILIPLYVD